MSRKREYKEEFNIKKGMLNKRLRDLWSSLVIGLKWTGLIPLITNRDYKGDCSITALIGVFNSNFSNGGFYNLTTNNRWHFLKY